MARDTSDTTRQGYSRPEMGSDWAEAWDELVEEQDFQDIQRGPTTDRPDEGDHHLELYLDPQQSIIYYWDDDAGSWETAVDGTTSYTDENAQDAVGAILSDAFSYDDGSNAIDLSPHTDASDAHHTKYTDADAVAAIEAESPLDLTGTVNVDGEEVATQNWVENNTGNNTYSDADAIAAIEAETPLELSRTVIGDPTLPSNNYPLTIDAGSAGTNRAIAIMGDPDAENHGNINWFHSNGNYVATISGDGDGDHLSIYVADVDDVSDTDGGQRKAMDLQTGPGSSNVDFPNLSQMRLWEQTGENPVNLDLFGSPGENAFIRWHSDAAESPGSGTLSYGLWQDGGGDMQFYDYMNAQYLWEYDGSAVDFPTGLQFDGTDVATVNDVFSASHSDLSDVAGDDHHEVFEPADYTPEADVHDAYTNADAIAAIEAEDPLELTGSVSVDGETVATQTWVENNTDSGSGFSGSHDDLSDVATDDHHAKTQPSEVDSSNWGDVEIHVSSSEPSGWSDGDLWFEPSE